MLDRGTAERTGNGAGRIRHTTSRIGARVSRGTASAANTVERYVWRPIAAPPPVLTRDVKGALIGVLGGTGEQRFELSRALAERGARTWVFDRALLNRDFPALPEELNLVIDLNVGHHFDARDLAAWKLAMTESLELVKALYTRWSEETDANKLVYLAVTRMGGHMGFGNRAETFNPLGGIWAGFAKSLPREMPNLKVRVLDLGAPSGSDSDVIVSELCALDGLIEIGWQDGARYTLASTREPVLESTLALDASDTVVFSGGARGIGFALARDLAERFGCRVVVTGRASIDDLMSLEATLSDSAFGTYRTEQLVRGAQQKQLRETRMSLDRLVVLREASLNLRSARAEGLPIEYIRCDFTDAESVGHLLSTIGSPSVAIHNAGIDTPLRLLHKSVATCLQTIVVKVDGFLQLIAKLPQQKLKAVCCVGSLTGRWGGMVGQMDYGAANEGLSRLGLWFRHQVDIPVKTLCWPTWEELGMVSNYQAALKYMAPLGVDEGVQHWRNELLAPGSGEITFIGEVGPALSPSQLLGYPIVSDIPGVDRLRAMAFYSGQVLTFVPGRSYRTRLVFDQRHHPCFQEFTVRGASAIPTCAILDQGLAAARWLIPPESHASLGIDAVQIVPNELRFDAPGLEIDVHVTRQGERRLLVRFTHTHSNALIARFLVTELETADDPLQVHEDDEHARALELEVRWRDVVFKYPGWRQSSRGTLRASVEYVPAGDLWLSPFVPDSPLPLAIVEQTIRRMSRESGGIAGLISIARILVQPYPSRSLEVDLDTETGNVLLTDHHDSPTFCIKGAKVS